MFQNSLSIKNCVRRPGRTTALIVLSLILCFTILVGTLVITGLQSGLQSLESRLGADIMVVPYEAATKSELDNMILQGNPGYFYMSNDLAEKVKSREGIGQVTEQFYLASTSSSCCSYKVQIIGFDPETDFVIKPWLKESGKDDLQYMEVFVGNSLNAFPGDELQFYGSTVKVAGKLDQTGTYLDTAVFASEETIRSLIQDAKESKLFDFGDVDPYEIVSCVMINVADGYTIEDVLNDINIHVRGVEAVQTQNMVSDVSGKLTGISRLIGALIVVVWILVLAIMILAFAMISNERKKEFAIIRLLGASRKKLAGIILKETLFMSVIGSTIGAGAAVLTASLFSGFIESELKMPFLLPNAGNLVIMFALAVGITVLAGTLSACVCAMKISKADAAVILRGEN